MLHEVKSRIGDNPVVLPVIMTQKNMGVLLLTLVSRFIMKVSHSGNRLKVTYGYEWAEYVQNPEAFHEKQKQCFCVSTEASTCPAPASPANLEEDSVQFNKLSYLGCTWVKAPRNEAEAQSAMTTLRAESAIPIPITLHVPCGPDGSVRSAML